MLFLGSANFSQILQDAAWELHKTKEIEKSF